MFCPHFQESISILEKCTSVKTVQQCRWWFQSSTGYKLFSVCRVFFFIDWNSSVRLFLLSEESCMPLCLFRTVLQILLYAAFLDTKLVSSRRAFCKRCLPSALFRPPFLDLTHPNVAVNQVCHLALPRYISSRKSSSQGFEPHLHGTGSLVQCCSRYKLSIASFGVMI